MRVECRVHGRLRVAEEGLHRLLVGHGQPRGLVVGVGQVGEDDLAPLLLRLQLDGELAAGVRVRVRVGGSSLQGLGLGLEGARGRS